MIGPLLLLAGLGLLLSGRARAAAPAAPKKAAKPPLMSEQQRIVREIEEIAQGKRAELSEPLLPAPAPAALPTEAERVVQEAKEIAEDKREELSDPSESAPSDDDDERALAEAAARAAAAQEGGRAAPTIEIGPVTPRGRTPAPKGKPAAAPAKPINMQLAKSTAPQVAAHIRAKKMNYDRKMLSLWQSRAGVAPDGIYGRGSAAALKYFTKNAPPALFAQGTAQYTPPA